MHSDVTLDIMDDVTASLGSAFRHFSHEVSPAFNTKELRREANARRRRQTQNTNQRKKAKPSDGELLKKTFNLCTYKYHSLDDFANMIRQLGTTDSYNTAIVSVVES
jgi:hypothetical protein